MGWGAESINVVRFNPSEQQVLAGAGSDRGVVLYDLRSGQPLTKMVMKVGRTKEKCPGRGCSQLYTYTDARQRYFLVAHRANDVCLGL